MEIKIDSLSSFIYEVNLLYSKWEIPSGDLWFRGVSSEKYNLLPGLKWRYNHLKKEPLERRENSIIEEFLQSSPALHDDIPKDPWQKYALMQHYGLPTRLLDWTKSPLVALFFALDLNNNEDNIIWCIDPFQLNKHIHDNDTIFTPKYFDEDDGIEVSSYLPTALRRNKSKKILPNPIAIESPLTNKRIYAQEGCFTVHGWKNNTIDNYFTKIDKPHIKKFIISASKIKEIKNCLDDIGIREDKIFQDLNSLSSRIIRDHS